MNTTTKIECAGYIVSNNDVIWGTGATAQTAWDDFLDGMKQASVKVIDDVDENDDATNDMIENGHEYTRASDHKIEPATAALLAEVEARGGAISWAKIGGVCCTRDEEDAA
jgi:hypothetical protein